MSNTSRVTPYDETAQEERTDSATSGIVESGTSAVSDLIEWLRTETPQEQAAIARSRAIQARDRLRAGRTTICCQAPVSLLPVSRVALHLTDRDALVRAAQELGFRRVEPMVVRTDSVVSRTPPPILLESAGGQRLALVARSGGRVSVQSAGGRARVESLVFQHTVMQVREHLHKTATDVTVQSLPTGEVQIRAREKGPRRPDGNARIVTQVYRNGMADVDVDGIDGDRCDRLVEGLAQAVEGQILRTHHKEARFRLPGRTGPVMHVGGERGE